MRLNFTPTIQPDGLIHLKVAPEVSSLDFTNAVTLQGFTIPALSTRRVESEMDLRDGQTFAIAGLIDNQVQQLLDKIPGIGDIPILGKLFQEPFDDQEQKRTFGNCDASNGASAMDSRRGAAGTAYPGSVSGTHRSDAAECANWRNKRKMMNSKIAHTLANGKSDPMLTAAIVSGDSSSAAQLLGELAADRPGQLRQFSNGPFPRDKLPELGELLPTLYCSTWRGIRNPTLRSERTCAGCGLRYD